MFFPPQSVDEKKQTFTILDRELLLCHCDAQNMCGLVPVDNYGTLFVLRVSETPHN
jgi:hypothetical protein